MKKTIAEILKYCPEGLPLWSPAFGNVKLKAATNTGVLIRTKRGHYYQLDVDGKMNIDGKCMLFPSKEQRDWDKFREAMEKAKKFDINTLKPFDKVLVRDNSTQEWTIGLWAAYMPDHERWKYQCIGCCYDQCVPYEGNEHLFLTKDMPDEYYITWEEEGNGKRKTENGKLWQRQ